MDLFVFDHQSLNFLNYDLLDLRNISKKSFYKISFPNKGDEVLSLLFNFKKAKFPLGCVEKYLPNKSF